METARDALIAKNVQWATKEKLHPRAIEYARLYANLTRGMLTVISDYERATDTNNPALLRAAWDNVIRYIRTLKPVFDASKAA